MCDMLGMDVAEPIYNLSEDLLSERFFKPSSLPHIVEKVTASAEFHHYNDMLLSLDRLVDLDDMIVSELEQ